MQIYNYMESLVTEQLEELLLEIPDICKCKKCKLDMAVMALNRLPPKYILSDKGRIFTKLAEADIQQQADVVKEITKAIIKVSKNPQH